jgi:hypothetical protein
MRSKNRMRAIRTILAFSTLFGVGGGCIAIYSFDKKPPVGCKQVIDCPGSDACGQRLCENGLCKLANFAEAGALTINNKQGNCQRFACDGKGNEIIEIDDTNVPVDGDNCTDDICTDGVPSNPRSPEGTQCGTSASVTCSAAGECQNCVNGSDCGEDNKCTTWTCEMSICVKNLQSIGTEVGNPVPGNCAKNLCNDLGESPETFVADDAPSDEDPCTADFCKANGDVAHDLLPEGTKCADCSACAADGLCKTCDAATSDCHMGACVPKPQTCMDGSECKSTYCVDGFCCNAECSSTCMGCSSQLTGIPSGICAPIINGQDPDGECTSFMDDVCVNGSCGCANGVLDGNEDGIDCGGNCNPCTGMWNCGGTAVCDGNSPFICCPQDWVMCANCGDQRQGCKDLQGTTCNIGMANKRFTLGVVGAPACLAPACRYVDCICE